MTRPPQSPTRRTLAIANFISLLGQPLVFLPITIALTLVGRLPTARLLVIVAIFTACTTVPLYIVIRRKVAAGTWSDMDVSDHGQRRGLYTIVLPVIAVSTFVFWWLDFPRELIIETAGSLVLSIVAMGINRWTKLSMHAMFGAYCAIALLMVNVFVGVAAFVLIGVVGWSRVVLGRHTVAQVIYGNSLGSFAGLILLWLLSAKF